jgi:hypothetical protein
VILFYNSLAVPIFLYFLTKKFLIVSHGKNTINIVVFEFFIRISQHSRMFLIILKKCNHVVENVSYDVNIVKTKINILTTTKYWCIERYTSVRYFRAPILNSLLFRSYLCINVKV